GVRRAADGQYFTLFGDEEAFKLPPLSAFRSEQERASFSTPHFGRYIHMDLPPNGSARRLFAFVPSDRSAKSERLQPAVVDWPRHRGHVIVFTSSFNSDWNDWPRTLSYPPFIQEVLRFAVGGTNRQTLQAGEALEEFVPAPLVGLNATLTHEDGTTGDAI